MDYRIIPKSGLKLSTVGIGSGSIEKTSEKEIVALLDYAEENGVNLIDMALSYFDVLPQYGAALKGRRNKFYLQNHFGMSFTKGEYARIYDLEDVKRNFETQLDTLKTDYTDIGFVHCIDSQEDFEKVIQGGTFDYMVDLKKQGVIKNLGFASHTVDICNRFIDTGEIDVFMFSINAAYDLDPKKNDPYGEDSKKQEGLTVSRERQKLYQRCVKENIGINVMKTYGGGKLLDPKQSPFGKAMTLPQCIQYALDRPAVLSCILGLQKREDFVEALHFFRATEQEKDYSFIAHTQQKELMGSCVYCNHCMPCPVGIDIGATHKYLDLHLAGDKLAKEHYSAMAKNASDCIECGVCEKRCPFGVNVREKMKQARACF